MGYIISGLNVKKEVKKDIKSDLEDFDKLNKDLDYIEYVKRKEILFIKNEIKNVSKEKFDYTRLIKYYKRKLVDYGVMKEITGFISNKNYTKIKKENNTIAN